MATADIDSWYQQQVSEAQAYANSIVSAQEALIKQRAELLYAQSGIPSAIGNATGLFQPPVIDTARDQSLWTNTSSGFLATMSGDLNGTSVAVSSSGQYQSANANLTVIGSNYTSLLLANILPRPFAFYVLPGFSFLEFEAVWNYLINLATSFDFAYRVIRSIQLFRKYWRVSAIHTPPADVRVDHMQNYGLYSNQQNGLQMLGAIVANPVFQCIILSIIFGFICSSFIVLYLPIYNQWIIGCVDQPSAEAGPGTFLSNNVFNISYEYALSNGDTTTNKLVDSINVDRDTACKTNIANAQNQFVNDQNEWNYILSKMNDVQYDAFAIFDCIDVRQADGNDTFGNLMTPTPSGHTACYNASMGQCQSLLDVSPGSFCQESLPPLVNATYACTSFTCPSYNNENGTYSCDTSFAKTDILQNTWIASCQAEWWVHANFLGSMMVIMMYILMNISRVLFVRGVARLAWRYLTDGRFSYLGTCERNGELKYPNVITADGWSMKRAIREALAVRIREYEKQSLGLALFAISLNLPYIVLLGVLSQQMKPIAQSQ